MIFIYKLRDIGKNSKKIVRNPFYKNFCYISLNFEIEYYKTHQINKQ